MRVFNFNSINSNRMLRRPYLARLLTGLPNNRDRSDCNSSSSSNSNNNNSCKCNKIPNYGTFDDIESVI
jgi:hypothetical protein